MLREIQTALSANLKNSPEKSFDLVFGCNGSHSGVRKLWFGPEQDYKPSANEMKMVYNISARCGVTVPGGNKNVVY